VAVSIIKCHCQCQHRFILIAVFQKKVLSCLATLMESHGEPSTKPGNKSESTAYKPLLKKYTVIADFKLDDHELKRNEQQQRQLVSLRRNISRNYVRLNKIDRPTELV
jgi:hypothetical protein